MRQAEDTRTAELPGLQVHRRRHRGRNRGDRVGPYGGDQLHSARKQARLYAGLTQPELASAAGLSERTVRNFEGSVGKASIEALTAIADALRKHGCPEVNIARATGLAKPGDSQPLLASLSGLMLEKARLEGLLDRTDGARPARPDSNRQR